MIITMHCGGMPFNGNTIKEQSLGGSETAAYYVARELARRGHRVTLFTNAQGDATYDGVKYSWAGEISERAPLGNRFHFYAHNTPCDVMLIQRAPGAFIHRWASKLNIAWLHDLALVRQKPMVASALWNIDALLTVSEWHKKQIVDTWGVESSLVRSVTNGVDLSIFDEEVKYDLSNPPFIAEVSPNTRQKLQGSKIRLLYSSRPERGLMHHLREGGIMERLWAIDKRFHLYVCNYDNKVAHMEELYQYLYNRIEQLPNCTALGHLTKQQLADVMRQCDAMVYPTEFEEVSCITAMEAMTAGLPFISSECAALPETCKESGSMLMPLKNGQADEDAFVKFLESGLDTLKGFKAPQLTAAKKYSWENVAEQFEKHFGDLFRERTTNPTTVLKHLVNTSDYYAAERYRGNNHDGIDYTGLAHPVAELTECYAFARERKWKEHYEAYYAYEKARGVNYGPEDCSRDSRFNTVAGYLDKLHPGSTILDYGCAHGHYTVNLAKRFPDFKFIGIDLAESNIEIARKWAKDDNVSNVKFYNGWFDNTGDVTGTLKIKKSNGSLRWYRSEPSDVPFDVIIAAEVLEHVEAPWDLVDGLASYLKPTGKMVITTPHGPWEAIGYKEHWPWRAHVHHFERDDLHDVFGHHGDFKVNIVANGADKRGNVLGSYVCAFNKPEVASGRINYDRKFSRLAPPQTLAVCLIVRDAELTLGKCLESVKDVADEIIVAVDSKTKDSTREIAAKYVKGFSDNLLFDIESPLEIGFDEARNRCIAKAKADWILWIDADEALYHPNNLIKYLRQNQFDGYAVKQIHYSVDPACVMKVDLPTRLFRNRMGVKFFGVVHEHPEKELNKGIGPCMVIEDIAIAHHGYSTEDVRRKRFERNIGLLVRDREKYPDRLLGKFLWLRDLAQMCRWELESNGGHITPVMHARAREGIKIWEELLDANQLRIITDIDNLGFYTTLVEILGEGFHFGFKMDCSKLNGGANPDRHPALVGRFASRAHAEKLFLKILSERTSTYDSKYF